MTGSRFVTTALAVAILTPALGAQQRELPPVTVRVHVADTLTGMPVSGAEVTLMRGLKTVVATATTDAAGNHDFMLVLDSSDYSIRARKIGYARADKFFSAERARQDVAITMKPAQPSLPVVNITAEESLRHQSYFIDADAIAASDRPLNDALDVVSKLRPDMILSRSGFNGGRRGTRTVACPPMREIWVNGQRVYTSYTLVNDVVASRARGTGNRLAPMGLGNVQALSTIAPEHIAEMTYHDCFDTSVGKIGSENALFIVLKPGVGFTRNVGSYVVGDTVALARR